MTQRFSFWEDLTIRENLRFIARMYGMDDAREVAWRTRSPIWDSQRAPTSLRARCPAAGSSASRSPRACCTTRSCCCSTSPPRASIRRRAATSGTSCTRSPRGHHRAGQHALHGRSRALPQARLHPRRQTAGAAAPPREVIASQPLVTWEVTGGDLRALARAAAERCPTSSRSPHSEPSLHVTGSDRARLDAALAAVQGRPGHALARDPAGARGCVHPPDARTRRAGCAMSTIERESHPVFSPSRWLGIVIKEFTQLKRDRLTFGMIVGIPVIQLILFGFAINTDPKHLPTVGDHRRSRRVLAQHRRRAGQQQLLRLHRRGARTRTTPSACSPPARRSSCSPSRRTSHGGWCAASAPRSCSRPTPPTRWRPAARSRRSTRSRAPRSCTT